MSCPRNAIVRFLDTVSVFGLIRVTRHVLAVAPGGVEELAPPRWQVSMAHSLSRYVYVRRIRLCDAGSEGMVPIASVLPLLTSLQTLNLSRNNIGPEGAASLSTVLDRCPALQTLNLSFNYIGAEGTASLLTPLDRCPALQTLNFSRNNIGPEGAAS